MPHISSGAVVATLGLVLLSACGASTSTAAQASPAPTTNLSCTSAGQASSAWSVPEPPSSPIVSAVVSGDTFTLTFTSGTPAFTVQQVPSAHFQRDPSGLPVDLRGTAGVRIAITGFSADVSNYAGPRPLDSGAPTILHAASIGDFEG